MHLDISIIIPCYNHGQYILEAIKSVEQNEENCRYEIIIVNDGSNDTFTINALNTLQASGYNVINQQNKGLPEARNVAIQAARGKYVLPLDSDNKIHKNYLHKALKILNDNPAIDILYGDCQLFGEDNNYRKAGRLNFGQLIKENYIDACALYKKELWEKLGGYDPSMVRGFEDWEFWINAYLEGAKFYYLEETCFYYRVRGDGMLRSVSTNFFEASKKYIYNKHSHKIITQLADELNNYKEFIYSIKDRKYKSILKLILGYKTPLHHFNNFN